MYKKTAGRWSPQEFDDYYDARFRETLREISKRLAKHGSIPEALAARLDEANRRRRLLAHHFFRDAADAVALDQVDALIDRLEHDRRFFAETDHLLESFMEPILERPGFTTAFRDKAVRDYQQPLEAGGTLNEPP